MPTFKHFEEILAWQSARHLTREIYCATRIGPFAADTALRNQIRRAAISVGSNIAEGFERTSYREFMHFLSIAKGSAGEVRSQLYVALDLGYVDQKHFDELYELADLTIRQIGRLISYLARNNGSKNGNKKSEPKHSKR